MPPRTSYNPVPMQQPLLDTSNPAQMLQYRQASYMPHVAGRKPVIKQQSLLGTVSPTKTQAMSAIESSAQHMHASYMPSPSSQQPLMQPSLLSTKRPTDIQTTSAVSSSVQVMFTLPTAMRSCKPYAM
ncbi:unnamed protein product [Symbiodinium sp. CCMP2456]|nr:unnamed protein product [Symbiodinium sp. CCMP2456]